jgi:hypothetical protein
MLYAGYKRVGSVSLFRISLLEMVFFYSPRYYEDLFGWEEYLACRLTRTFFSIALSGAAARVALASPRRA